MTDGPRDLACAEYWEESIARSRRRREAAERTLNFGPIDSKRIAVPAALLVGGLAVTEVVTSGGGGTGGGGGVLPQDATAASATTEAPAPAKAKAKPVAEKKPAAKRSAAKRPAAKRSAAKRSAAKRSRQPKPTIRTVAQAQALGGFKRGMKGPGVIQLQRQLGVTADGIYGPTTLKAVHRMQKRHDLNTDGIVGPATWQAISAPAKSSTTRPAVQRQKHRRTHPGGATVSAARLKRGGEVEALQAKLGLAVDGDYGAKTTAAVKRWQKRHGLHADGVVGPATWQALGLSGGNRTLHPHNFGGKRHSNRRSSTRHSRGRSGASGGSGGGGGGGGGVVARAIAAANRIATKPYRYGGGHGSFNDTAYDCSGSVSYVLHGAGLLDAPLASGGFMTWGAPGPGKYITIYAKPDHMFMTINGRRFDTGWGGKGNRWASGSRPTAGFTVRHPPGL